MQSAALITQYLSGAKKIAIPQVRTPFDKKKVVELIGASGNNLKDVNLTIPVGLFSNDTFFKIAHSQLNGATTAVPAPFKKIKGLEHFDKVIDIDQSCVVVDVKRVKATGLSR